MGKINERVRIGEHIVEYDNHIGKDAKKGITNLAVKDAAGSVVWKGAPRYNNASTATKAARAHLESQRNAKSSVAGSNAQSHASGGDEYNRDDDGKFTGGKS